MERDEVNVIIGPPVAVEGSGILDFVRDSATPLVGLASGRPRTQPSDGLRRVFEGNGDKVAVAASRDAGLDFRVCCVRACPLTCAHVAGSTWVRGGVGNDAAYRTAILSKGEARQAGNAS
jgi:hypothetical protein